MCEMNGARKPLSLMMIAGCWLFASTALAQDPEPGQPEQPPEPANVEPTSPAPGIPEDPQDSLDAQDRANFEGDLEQTEELLDEEEEDEDEEDERKSAHGSYEWKFNFGGGIELGAFFTQLGRWNGQLLEPNNTRTFDTDVALNIDLALELSPIENLRLTLFGGLQGPFVDDPSLSALYVGVEPAFTAREGNWELALGMGAGLGSVDLSLATGQSANTGLLLLRPFLEARRYASEWMAAYARVGFNYWHIRNPEFTGLTFENNQGQLNSAANLGEGGFYVALGLRFGSYPDQIKFIPDSDNDGLRDDVDDCPDEPGLKELGGCPVRDKDEDGIPDDIDKCPEAPEDKDGFEDTDGCPDPDNDQDGVLDAEDKCPETPGVAKYQGCPMPDRDKDGVADEDDKCPDTPGLVEYAGCPDTDSDGIPDNLDKCPTEAETFNGVEDTDGCPDGEQMVIVTETEVKITQTVFFDTGKASIQERSFLLLDTVATVLNNTPKITKLRVEGHTDDVGNDDKNLELSKARAQSVKDYLIGKGVAAERLTSEGFGEGQPACANIPELLKNTRKNKKELEACRADNRRVAFKIVELKGQAVEASDSVMVREEKVVDPNAPADAPPVPADAPTAPAKVAPLAPTPEP